MGKQIQFACDISGPDVSYTVTSRANSLRYYKPLARLCASLEGECLSRKWLHQLDIYTINNELHVLLFTEGGGEPQRGEVSHRGVR
jgi:hypothetical protein